MRVSAVLRLHLRGINTWGVGGVAVPSPSPEKEKEKEKAGTRTRGQTGVCVSECVCEELSSETREVRYFRNEET